MGGQKILEGSILGFQQYRNQTQNDSGQLLWAPKKCHQKIIKRGFLHIISKLRINKMHFKPEYKCYYSLTSAEKRRLYSLKPHQSPALDLFRGFTVPPRLPAKTDVPKFLLDTTLSRKPKIQNFLGSL